MECYAVDCILRKLPVRLSEPLKRCRDIIAENATEIVLRSDRPLCVYFGHKCRYVTETGSLSDMPNESSLHVMRSETETLLSRLCNDSIYAYQEQINSGFVTVDGGVRVGLCGRAVIRNGEIANICDITTLSFRIAREVKGCAKELLSLVDPYEGVFICGPPGSGKTTVIRDMVRLISYRYRVSVLDERGELSAAGNGGNGFDLGMADVYFAYPKGAAAQAAMRSMSPDIIICDELGDREDVFMLRQALRCGVSFIASAHAVSMDDLRSRRSTRELLRTGAFRYIVFLAGKDEAGCIRRVYELSDAGV